MRVNMTHNENTAGVQMKNVGFIRKADSPGRIVIPKEICKIPGFDANLIKISDRPDCTKKRPDLFCKYFANI